MAKTKSESIYTALERRTIEVVDGAETLTVNLPDWFPTDITREQVDNLNEDTRFGLIAAGLQQAIIQVRAIARRENAKDDGDIQGCIDKYAPKAPSKALDEEGKALAYLNSLDPESLARVLAKANN